MQGENILLALVVAPFCMLSSILSLTVLKRIVDYLEYLSLKPKASMDKIESTLKPIAKTINDMIKRAMGESVITINTTSLMLCSVLIVLLGIYFEIMDFKHQYKKKQKKD